MIDDKNEVEVVCIGDSTLDNRIWVDGLFATFIKSRLGIDRDSADERVSKYQNSFFKPALSVIENLKMILPDYKIHDYTNDGFTTTDVLKGNARDKVFGTGNFLPFPDTFFEPLKEAEKDIKKSQYVIVSVGGNNFREFLQSVQQIPAEFRNISIKSGFEGVFQTLLKEYVEIVQKIRAMNPDAKIILMTQYYPSALQNNYKIYEFMHELGKILNIGGPSHDAMTVIHNIVQKTYAKAFEQLANDKNIIVADITSSLNPYDKDNHVSQIEPSGLGGQRIAMMLQYLMTNSKVASGNSYRFLPGFFGEKQSDAYVIAKPLKNWVPEHPYVLKNNSANAEMNDRDLYLLQRLAKWNEKCEDKFSTKLFKLINTQDRFTILMNRIKNVVDCYHNPKSKDEQKAFVLKECMESIKNKGILSIYTMDTPGYQTPYQTELDRLQLLLESRSEEDQASLLAKLYDQYVSYCNTQQQVQENIPDCKV